VRVRVCGLREIPEGGMIRVDVRKKELLVAKVGGRVYVTDVKCTHEEGDLSLGIMSGEIVTCPLHGAKFKLSDGAVVEGPDGEPPETIPALKTYRVVVEGEDIYIEE